MNWEDLGPRVTVTRLADGTSRVLPLEMLEGGDYLDIGQSPDEGFPPPIFIGNDPSQRTDVRTRQTLLKDARRGMGADEYEETTSTSSFRTSRAETRYANVIVGRALPVRLGSGTIAAASTRLAYVGSTARWFAYSSGTAWYFRESDDTWVTTTLTNGSYHFHQGAGGLYYIHNNRLSISTSTTGASWTAIDTTDIAAPFGSARTLDGCCTHDNKLFVISSTLNAETYTLWQSVDAATAPATATFTRLGDLVLGQQERPSQLFTWKFPPEPNRPGLFALTNRALYFYDDTADAASQTAWKKWHTWDIPYAIDTLAFALPWGRTGDLYVVPSALYQDNIYQFTGSSIAQHSPNKGGGLPPTEQGTVTWAMANHHAIVAFIGPSAAIGTGNAGMIVAFNEQEGWHHVFAPDASSVGSFPASQSIVGMGLGPTSVLTVLSNGQVWEQSFLDTKELPQYATTARSYDPTPLIHQWAKTDIGSPTLPKAGLYYEANAKIPTGGSLAIAYRVDDSDQTGAWTTLGTATSATAMPYRVGFPDSVTGWKQIEIRETLTRGTAASATVIRYSGIVHATLLPPARFNTVFRVDLRRESFQNVIAQVNGYGLSELRTWIRGCHGLLVSFTIHHPASALTVARGQAAVTPIESGSDALGRYTFQIRDMSTPASG